MTDMATGNISRDSFLNDLEENVTEIEDALGNNIIHDKTADGVWTVLNDAVLRTARAHFEKGNTEEDMELSQIKKIGEKL